MNETVILVHGVGLFGLEMIPLSMRLKKSGYNTKIFSYSPWRYTITQCAEQLEDFVSRFNDSNIYFVGHSLGGLVISEFLAKNPKMNFLRAVNLATPHSGSVVARRLLKIPFGRALIGKALASSCDYGIRVPEQCEIGAIAGRFNLILGWFLLLSRPNDTIVSFKEVEHPALKETLLITATHASMLLSKRVARQVDYFLQNGEFQK